jgi:hypothetical protein
MSSQKQVLENMAAMYKVASNALTQSDFLDAFKAVVTLIQKTNADMVARNDTSMVEMDKKCQKLLKDIEKSTAYDFEGLKSKVEKALKEQDSGMRFIYDKVAALEDGEDGTDGHTPTKDELIALILPLIPKAIDGKDAEVDIDSIVAKVMEKLPKNMEQIVTGGRQQLLVGGVKKGVANYLDVVAGSNVSVAHTFVNGVQQLTISSGAGAGATNVRDEDASSLTLAHTPDAGTLQLFRGGARQSVVNGDYTIAGAVITLTSALQVGETLTADYSWT